MRSIKKLIKPFDIVLVICLVCISFIPMVVFAMNHETPKEGSKAIALVIQEGKVIREVTLTGQFESEEFTIYGKGNQYNIIQVENEQIRIKEDNSPDQIGVMMGWKSRPGETIICLPHKMMIEIVSNQPEEPDDGVILSH